MSGTYLMSLKQVEELLLLKHKLEDVTEQVMMSQCYKACHYNVCPHEFDIEDQLSKEDIGQNIKYALTLKKLSCQDFADFVNVSVRTVENWCTGKSLPDMFQLQAISRVTKFTMIWFYTKQNKK